MPTESGYSNQKKKGQSQFKTIQSVGSSQFGAPVVQKSLYDITTLPQSIVSVSDIYGKDGQITYWNIEITGHTASAGNILRMITGALKSFEYEIAFIVDVNNFYILPISETAPIATDTAKIMGWITSKSDDEGNSVVNMGPSQFIKDSVNEQVTEDTVDPTNNLAMPSSLFIYKDGIQYPVNIDTGTPANTVGVPVILTGASGPVNITAGDLNVQLTDLGANFDATRIGDGSGNYLGVNASNEAFVHDTDLLAKLTSLEAKDFATQTTLAALLTELNLKADLTETQPVSIATLPLPSGSATEAKQDIGNLSLSNIDGKLQDNGTLDAGNSSTTLLGIGGVFTGTAVEITKYACLNVNVVSDVASAVNGVKVEFSPDGVVWAHSHSTTYSSASGVGYIFNAEFRYARVVYTNGTSAQSTFNLQTILKSTKVQSSLYTLDQTVFGSMFAELNKSTIIGKTTGGGGGFVDVKVTPSGALTVEADIVSSVLPTGAATEATLSSFSGKSSSALVTVPFDEIVTTYVGATTDISTVVYKNASATVATLTMSYDGSNRLIGVVRS
jgi:hypothetical protein